MQKIKILFTIVLITTVFFGCTNKRQNSSVFIDDFSNFTEPLDIRQEFSFRGSFTISFWTKPLLNYFGSTILTIEDDSQTLYLLNNSFDENYCFTGLSLVHDNGSLYGGADFLIKNGEFCNIVIAYENNLFYLYLNGKEISKKTFSDNFNSSKIKLVVRNDGFRGEFKTFEICNYKKDTISIEKSYIENSSLLLDNIDFGNGFKNNAKGKVALPNIGVAVEYEYDPKWLNIVEGYLYVNSNATSEDIKTTLNVKLKGTEITKNIDLIIRGNNKKNTVDNVAKKLDNELKYFISESEVFEDQTDNCRIEYNVTGNAIYRDGHFIKTSNKDKEKITVQATVLSEGYSTTIEKELLLIDKYYGYVLVYFDGNDGWPYYANGDENVYLAVSKDLKEWDRLTNEGILTSNEGTNRFRDPFITRNKEGDFIITCTEGYDNPNIYISRTEDLINFDTKIVNISVLEPMIGLDGRNAWAPEIVYNNEKGIYTIMFSEPDDDNYAIYGIDTLDFESFGFPYVYFNCGYNVIDANVSLIDGTWYLFYKDENNKTIHYAMSDDLNNPSWIINDESDINVGYYAEGPFVIQDFNTKEYFLYTDAYKIHEIKSGLIEIENSVLDIDLKCDDEITGIGGVRHFSIIPLTQKEYDNILEYYR